METKLNITKSTKSLESFLKNVLKNDEYVEVALGLYK